DETTIGTDVLSEFATQAVALTSDVARNPRLPGSELTRLKGDALRQVAIQKSNPQALARDRFRNLLYGEHPYGHAIPAQRDVEGLTIGDVTSFYADNFGAQRARLYVAGRFDVAAVKRAIDAGFGSWERGPAPATKVPKPVTRRVLDVTDRPGAAQS